MPKVRIFEDWDELNYVTMARVADDADDDADIIDLSKEEYLLLDAALKMQELAENMLRSKIRARLEEIDMDEWDDYDFGGEVTEIPVHKLDEVLQQAFTAPVTRVEVK